MKPCHLRFYVYGFADATAQWLDGSGVVPSKHSAQRGDRIVTALERAVYRSFWADSRRSCRSLASGST
ncbi:MAG: hypothetical protein KC729_18515, partial [Candidatus Eisenbacteria bacterium]|nr:hypothetical protein [Candidatus Eisenbacteria bacterium]